MMTKTTFRDILKKLSAKSQRDQVHWQRDAGGQGYVVSFADRSRIRVNYESPKVEPDWASAEFIVEGRTVLEVSAEEGDSSDDFEILRSLYQEADRKVVGWDKALEQIERQLESDEPVGAA